MLSPAEIAAIAAKALEDKKAKDVKILRTAEQTVIADYFVICNGTSSTHVKALVDEVDKQLSLAGEPPVRREGLRSRYMGADGLRLRVGPCVHRRGQKIL